MSAHLALTRAAQRTCGVSATDRIHVDQQLGAGGGHDQQRLGPCAVGLTHVTATHAAARSRALRHSHAVVGEHLQRHRNQRAPFVDHQLQAMRHVRPHVGHAPNMVTPCPHGDARAQLPVHREQPPRIGVRGRCARRAHTVQVGSGRLLGTHAHRAVVAQIRHEAIVNLRPLSRLPCTWGDLAHLKVFQHQGVQVHLAPLLGLFAPVGVVGTSVLRLGRRVARAPDESVVPKIAHGHQTRQTTAHLRAAGAMQMRVVPSQTIRVIGGNANAVVDAAGLHGQRGGRRGLRHRACYSTAMPCVCGMRSVRVNTGT